MNNSHALAAIIERSIKEEHPTMGGGEIEMMAEGCVNRFSEGTYSLTAVYHFVNGLYLTKPHYRDLNATDLRTFVKGEFAITFSLAELRWVRRRILYEQDKDGTHLRASDA
jgi:hypothetical protein